MSGLEAAVMSVVRKDLGIHLPTVTTEFFRLRNQPASLFSLSVWSLLKDQIVDIDKSTDLRQYPLPMHIVNFLLNVRFLLLILKQQIKEIRNFTIDYTECDRHDGLRDLCRFTCHAADSYYHLYTRVIQCYSTHDDSNYINLDWRIWVISLFSGVPLTYPYTRMDYTDTLVVDVSSWSNCQLFNNGGFHQKEKRLMDLRNNMRRTLSYNRLDNDLISQAELGLSGIEIVNLSSDIDWDEENEITNEELAFMILNRNVTIELQVARLDEFLDEPMDWN